MARQADKMRKRNMKFKLQRRPGRCKKLERCRADIGAVREPEEDEVPLSFERTPADR